MFHGRSHHQEGHADTDGDEDLDQLSHPGVRPVTFINNLHVMVGRGVMDVGGLGQWGHTRKKGGIFFGLRFVEPQMCVAVKIIFNGALVAL